MKGFPPVEAFVLLLLMSVIGFGSYRFIHHEPEAHVAQPAAGAEAIQVVEGSGHQHETEMELSFSSLPKVVRVMVLDDADAEPKELARVEGESMTNPGYLDLLLPCGEERTYWLDISWAEPPAEGALHMCQLVMTSSDASSTRRTFTCSEAEMNETFTFSVVTHS